MKHTKYDGKLTDALIQTVVDAENRLNGLESNVVPQPEASVTPQIDRQAALNMPVAPFFGWSDQKAVPTDTERAEAWRRSHLDYEPEE